MKSSRRFICSSFPGATPGPGLAAAPRLDDGGCEHPGGEVEPGEVHAVPEHLHHLRLAAALGLALGRVVVHVELAGGEAPSPE